MTTACRPFGATARRSHVSATAFDFAIESDGRAACQGISWLPACSTARATAAARTLRMGSVYPGSATISRPLAPRPFVDARAGYDPAMAPEGGSMRSAAEAERSSAAPVATPEAAAEDALAPELSVVMPCLNEARTIGICIRKAQESFARIGISGEVVVADNGSTDGSQQIAEDMGARVVPVERRGYGAALTGGIAAARGRWVIMGDADDSYDFSALEPFVERLRAGYDLVAGNRFKGGIHPEAMPWLHRRLGNPALSFIGRRLYGTPCGDIYCGLRGFDRDKVRALDIRSSGMEFAI